MADPDGRRRPTATVPFMRHIVMRLPEEAKAEFIYMVPFTPRGKDNLAAWMVARNDGDGVRQAAGVPALAAEPGVRPAADREPDQPGHRDLPPGLAVGPARLHR